MNSKTLLVVDDELESVYNLTRLIQTLHKESTIFQAIDFTSALATANVNAIDIAFLDIDLPGQNGIELAAALLECPVPPIIIFVTASNQYAVNAFELNAVDYLVKPLSVARVEEALIRADTRLKQQQLRQDYTAAVTSSVENSIAGMSKLWAERANGARVLIDFSDIGWASSKDKELFIRVAHDELRVRMSLSELIKLLPADTFVRVHRSHIVNIQLAREIISWDSHSMTLVMGDAGKTEIPVSRSYVHQLKQIAGW